MPDWRDIPSSPFNLITPGEVTNPVLTAADVTDIAADFVADPFLFYEAGTWYMFFEVLESSTNLGCIGLATSPDGFHWGYDKIVLSENTHLAYPQVFKYGGNYYMIPDANETYGVQLYQAINFPYDWVHVTTLVSGMRFVDASIFYYNNIWWMFVSDASNQNLYLYYSDHLTEGWTEHPKSPVVAADASKARPGGRAFVYSGDRIIRTAQKDDWYYGEMDRAFQVDTLTKTSYADHEIPESPVLSPGSGWNVSGMHTFDPWWAGSYWLAAVDGKNGSIWSIGIFISPVLGSNSEMERVIAQYPGKLTIHYGGR